MECKWNDSYTGKLALPLTLLLMAITISGFAYPGCTIEAAANYDAEATEDDGSCLFETLLQVDMSEETVDMNGVHVAGDFQGWNPAGTPLSDQGNGVWSTTVLLGAGQEILYKFINGNDWPQAESVPPACGEDDGFGSFNRSHTAGAEGGEVDLHCYAACFGCAPTDVAVTFIVESDYIENDAEGMHFASNVLDWDPAGSPMTNLDENSWAITLFLPPGTEVQYKFVNGNQWSGAELLPQNCSFEGNRTHTVTGEEAVGPVCFGYCETCSAVVIEGCTDPASVAYNPFANADDGSCSYMVTFVVNMGGISVLPAGLHLGANFQGWDAAGTPMSDAGNGLYTFTQAFTAGSVLEFKFINGDDWSQAESVPQECGEDDGFNGFQRVYVVPETNSTIPVTCFSSCVDCTDCSGIEGCTYPGALNYNADAEIDDGSCQIVGCLDAQGVNFNPMANVEDGCIYGDGFCGVGTVWDPNTMQCVEDTYCQSDFNNDGLVNSADLILFLSEFGTECL